MLSCHNSTQLFWNVFEQLLFQEALVTPDDPPVERRSMPPDDPAVERRSMRLQVVRYPYFLVVTVMREK